MACVCGYPRPCAAAASVVFGFWYLGTLEADFSAAAAFEGDLGFVSLHYVIEAVGEDELCDLDSKAVVDCDFALEEGRSVVEAVEMVRHCELDGSAAAAMDGDFVSRSLCLTVMGRWAQRRQ